jgi:hypothetical protein
LAEGSADAVTGVGENETEAHPCFSDAVELSQRDLGLGARNALRLGHAGAPQALGVVRPGLGQEQAQGNRHRHLVPGQSQRHKRLAVGGLAECRGVLRRNADRTRALLWKRRVIDNKESVGSAHQPVSLDQQFAFQRSRIPGPRGHEVVQAVVASPSRAAIGCTLLRSPGPIRPAM